MSLPYVGEIRPFGFNFAPRGWAACDGQLVLITQNEALFSLLGTIYGGDGRTTFGLPDLRGRVALHFGSGPGLSPRPIGQKAGVEEVTLTVNQIPGHTHAVSAAEDATTTQPGAAVPAPVASAAPSGYAAATDGTTMDPAMVANAGGNRGHHNLQPFQVVNWCIALTGIYPSRH